MAIEMPAQRLEIGDVILVQLPGEDGELEANVMREIERTPTVVRAWLRVGEGDPFIREWAVDEFVTVVRGP